MSGMAPEMEQTKKATVYLNTIKEFSSSGGGNYELSSVKEVRSTEAFDKFDEIIKQCQSRFSFNECKQEQLLLYLKEICSCAPFTLFGLEAVAKVGTK